ncbi:MAG: hypothetical protein ACLFT4_01330 [Bacteroidales bacterium]
MNLDQKKQEEIQQILSNPLAGMRKMVQGSLFYFLKYFWPEYSKDEFQSNWHIKVITSELQQMAERVALGLPKKYDLIINVPPGTSKTSMVSIMFPAWCWSNWYWMRFITAGYTSGLSLESAEYSRDVIKSERFRNLFPELEIKLDKDTKSNFRIVKKVKRDGREQTLFGGNRFSTSVGGTLLGFHGNILILDDPIDPERANVETLLNTANRWVSQTLSTRKVDKRVTPLILIQQRLHQNDPTGNILQKRPNTVKLISLPGEIKNYEDQVHPKELKKYYQNGLLDPNRLDWATLKQLEQELGQYAYAGQIGQKPVPPGGGMFKIENFMYIDELPNPANVLRVVRYWDKAGTKGGGAYTVGVKMHQVRNGTWVISDVKRGQWTSNERERIIRATAEADGQSVEVWVEQEPGPIWEEEFVQMGDGSISKLKDIKEGDFVINGYGKRTKVEANHKQGTLPVYKIKTFSGREVQAASDHPFLTPNGFTALRNLKKGDILGLKLKYFGNIVPDKIESIEYVGEKLCRCLTVEEGESFIVNDIVVHNSGGKESAESTIRNLAGFAVYADKPTGDKVKRADPYSVQVNNNNVYLLRGQWNKDFIDEHTFFPYSTYKDQVDAASGAFAKLTKAKEVVIW